MEFESNQKTSHAYFRLETDLMKPPTSMGLSDLDDQHILNLQRLGIDQNLDVQLQGQKFLSQMLNKINLVSEYIQNYDNMKLKQNNAEQSFQESQRNFQDFQQIYKNQLLNLEKFDEELLKINKDSNLQMNDKFKRYKDEQEQLYQILQQRIQKIFKEMEEFDSRGKNNKEPEVTQEHLNELKVQNQQLFEEINQLKYFTLHTIKNMNKLIPKLNPKKQKQEKTPRKVSPQQQSHENKLPPTSEIHSKQKMKTTIVNPKSAQKTQLSTAVKKEQNIDQEEANYRKSITVKPREEIKDQVQFKTPTKFDVDHEAKDQKKFPEIGQTLDFKRDLNQEMQNLISIVDEYAPLQPKITESMIENNFKRMQEEISSCQQKIYELNIDDLRNQVNKQKEQISQQFKQLTEQDKTLFDQSYQTQQQLQEFQHKQEYKNITIDDINDIITQNQLGNYQQHKNNFQEKINKIDKILANQIEINKSLEENANNRVHNDRFQQMASDVEYNVLMMRNLQNSDFFSNQKIIQDKIKVIEGQISQLKINDEYFLQQLSQQSQMTGVSINNKEFVTKGDLNRESFRINDQLLDLKVIFSFQRGIEKMEDKAQEFTDYLPKMERIEKEMEAIKAYNEENNVKQLLTSFQNRIKFELDFIETNLRKQIDNIEQILKEKLQNKSQQNIQTQTIASFSDKQKSEVEPQQLMEIQKDLKLLAQEFLNQFQDIESQIAQKANSQDLNQLQECIYFIKVVQQMIEENNSLLFSKLSDKNDVKKFISVVEMKLNELFKILKNKQDVKLDSLITKKQLNWTCISCDNEIQQLKVDVFHRHDWPKFPPKDQLPEPQQNYAIMNYYLQDNKKQIKKKQRNAPQSSLKSNLLKCQSKVEIREKTSESFKIKTIQENTQAD